MHSSRLSISFIGILLAVASAHSFASEQDTASYAINTEVRASSDQRTRGISDSLNEPALKLTVQLAHQSGLIAQAEFATVSKKQFLDGGGLGVTLAGGYRFGDPDGWHFGAGLATEIFPGAGYDAPHGFDLVTGMPTDVRRTRYDSAFAVLEVGYGAVEARLLNVISDTYRGADTGGVCGAMLATMADPTQALECYGRGDNNSRGSWLLDVDYKFNLNASTVMTLHGGYQKVANFKEADFSDLGIGIVHKRWGFEWSANWVATNTRVRELYLVQDGDALRSTDNTKLVLGVTRRL